MLVQKQAQDQAEITNHLETLAQRDTEIRNLRLDIQKVSDKYRHKIPAAHEFYFSAL